MKRATRDRFERIVLGYVIALAGREPASVSMTEILPKISAAVPGVTADELEQAVRWSLRRGEQKGRALERAARMGCRREMPR